MIRARAIILACACFAIAGCSFATKTSSSADHSAALAVLESLPATGEVRAVDIYPEESAEHRFTIAEGGEIVIRVSPTAEHDATFTVSEGDKRTTWLKTDDQGNIVMTAVFEADDDAISLFNPPLVVAFKQMNAGQEYTSESAMKVVNARNTTSIRESGKAKRTITYTDDQRIRIPAGEFVAKRLSVQFKADLKLADANETTTIWVDPQSGIIAKKSEEQVKILGLGGGKHARTIVLAN